MFRKQLLVNGPVIRTEDVCYHFLGSQADESLTKLLDLTRNQRQKFENNFLKGTCQTSAYPRTPRSLC